MADTGESSADHSGRGWLSEADLLEAINEMGYNVSPSELSALRDDIEEFIEEDELNECRDDEGNLSLFSSLQFIGMPPKNIQDERQNVWNSDVMAINRAMKNAEMEVGALGKRAAPRGHCAVSIGDGEGQEGTVDRDAISDLIFEGYRCIERLCADNTRLSILTKQVVQSQRTIVHPVASSEVPIDYGQSPPQFEGSDEQHGMSDSHFSDEHASSTGRATHIDPSIRPTLCRLPGGVPFKHDPVKKMELYQKEWRRNPPPGDKKRLALRWKVREYMLQQDVPRVNVYHLNRLRTPNPEWVPNSYMT